ncbi:MAG: DUF1573 domain-containing protein [Kiritimatiellia bacterium]
MNRLPFLLSCLMAAPAAFAVPKLTCDEPKAELGKAETGTKVTHVFNLTNAGDEPLAIESVKPGCGCTTTQLPKNVIAPGETVGLQTVLDLTMRRGDQIKHVDVFSNDGGKTNTPFRLEMSVFATDPFRVDPETHSLGQLAAGKPIERRTRISRVDGQTFHIRGARATQNNSTSRWEVVEEGKVYDLITTLPTEGKMGHLFENVMVDIDHPTLPFLSVQFVASLSSPYQFAPQEITLSPGPGTLSQTVTVRSGQVVDFRIVKAEWPDDSVKIDILEPLRLGQQVRISGIKPNPAWNGKFLVIRTDQAAYPEVRIPIRVEGVAP